MPLLSVEVGSGCIVQLPERTWGAPAVIPNETMVAAAGTSKLTSSISVLREPFAPFNATTRKLPTLLRSLGKGHSFAVTSEAAGTYPHLRLVVDEYKSLPGGKGYQLQTMATDLLTFLRNSGAKVALVPGDVSSPSTLSTTAVKGVLAGISQSSNEVFMVSPTAFGFNEQAAQDNSFMHAAEKPGEGEGGLTRQVLKEYSSLYHELTEGSGVRVKLFEHSLSHGTPDACFPNNWFSTHPKGEAAGGLKEDTLVLYPMKHPNRSAERRADMIEVLKQRGYPGLYDMSTEEKNGKYFEGTGVLVIDRINGVAYVNISERADASLAEAWVKRMGYKDLVTFRSSDLRKKAVYHTNVMMAVGTGVAIVCAESVQDVSERNRLLSALSKTHEVVEISLEQMDHLCGNALEVQSSKGLPVMAMSTQAFRHFTDDQIKAIRRHVAHIAHAPIDTLEKVGGGGVRCTLAEIF